MTKEKKEKLPLPKLSEYNSLGKICLFICTFGFSGLFPFMPGTIGSIVASFISFLCIYFLSTTQAFIWQINLALFTFILGWICSWYLKHLDKRADPGYIVIDEVSAVFLINSIVFMFIGQDLDVNNIKNLLIILSFNFVLFRIFDILKPSVIGYFDKKCKNAFGLMFDDTLSGVVTIFISIVVITILRIYQFLN